MIQAIICNQGSHGQEPATKRVKMDDRLFQFTYEHLHQYLFEKQNDFGMNGTGLEICENTNSILTNHEASNTTKDMPNMVRLCRSSIPGTTYGIQATQSIPIGAWIGPYQGTFVAPDKASGVKDSSYLWEIFKDGKLYSYVDGSDENTASWMRFIRCARHKEEQNLYAFQYMNKIYYRTHKTIEPGQELLVWYDEMYTQYMGIPCEGIYDMASQNGTFHLSGTVVKVTEEEPLTPPTTPTKCTDNPFNRQLPNVARPLNGLNGSTSPVWQDKASQFADQDEATANQIETRKRTFDSQPIRFEEQKRTSNQMAGVLAQIPPVPSTHQAIERDTKMASVQQFTGLPTNTDENKATSPTALDASTGFPSLYQGKEPISVDKTCPDVAQQQPMDSKANEFQCGQCKKKFIQRAILQTHVCAGVLLKPYQCGHCNETFSSPGIMRLHSAAHQGKKPFKCGYCMRSFTGATTLNNHIRTHTGEKPFACLRCGKMFTKGLQLSRHYKTPGDCVP